MSLSSPKFVTTGARLPVRLSRSAWSLSSMHQSVARSAGESAPSKVVRYYLMSAMLNGRAMVNGSRGLESVLTANLRNTSVGPLVGPQKSSRSSNIRSLKRSKHFASQPRYGLIWFTSVSRMRPVNSRVASTCGRKIGRGAITSRFPARCGYGTRAIVLNKSSY